MASARYDSEDVSVGALSQSIHFKPSGRTAKNRLLKGAMVEGLATWNQKVPSERGIPTSELIDLYRR